MLARLLATDSGRVELTLLRVSVALVLWPHGAQKLCGWFGGFGFSATQGYFTETVGLPWVLGATVTLVEFFGPLLLLAGLGTRVVALAVALIMLGAIGPGGHFEHGFFMNWFGVQAGEGFEFHLLMLAMSVALAIAGGGAQAIDALLHGRLTTSARAVPASAG